MHDDAGVHRVAELQLGDSDSYGAGVRLSYRLTSVAAPLVRPYAQLLYTQIDGAEVTERTSGADGLALSIHDRSGLRGTVGIRFADSYEGYGHVLRPSLELGVAHQFEDTRSTLDVQPMAGARSFRAYGSAVDRTAYVANASLDLSVGSRASIVLGYGGEVARDYSQHEINLGFRVVW